MSSNIRVTRVCEYCGNAFIAKTTVTRSCSEYCAKRLYKVKRTESKIIKSNSETNAILLQPIEELKAKEFLTVRDMAKLLNCSIRTAYNLINRDLIKAVNISERKTLIKRSEIDKLFL